MIRYRLLTDDNAVAKTFSVPESSHVAVFYYDAAGKATSVASFYAPATNPTGSGGNNAVGKIVAGANVTISPASGTGDVTINAASGGTATTTPFPEALAAAFASGTVLNWTGGPVKLTAPIVLKSSGNIIGFGLRGNGAKITCAFSGGGYAIHLLIDEAGHNIRSFRLQDFTVSGSGHEGAIKMECNRNDSWIYQGEILNVKCEGHSGHAIWACGSVFEFDASSIGSTGGLGLFRATERGAKASDPGGTDTNRGLPSAMTGSDWRPRDFKGDAILLDSSTQWRECFDLRLENGYVVTGQGAGYGIKASGGITKVRGVGFENLGGKAAIFCGYRGGRFEECQGTNASTMKYLIEAELTGPLEIKSCSVENEGSGTGIRLASVKDLQGNGKIILDPGGRSDPKGADIDTTFTGSKFMIASYAPKP